MGTYNPDAPFVLGNEFAGIVNSPMAFQLSSDTVEYGYNFTTTAGRVMQDARVYAQTPGYALDQNLPPLSVNVFPAGAEDASGPVRSLIIPANAGYATCTTTTDLIYTANNVTANAAAAPGAAVAALGTAVQGYGRSVVSFIQTTNDGYAAFYFNAAEYAPALVGKRILGVNVLYRLNGDDAQAAQYGSIMKYGYIQGASTRANFAAAPVISDVSGTTPSIRRLPLGSSVMATGGSTIASPYLPATVQAFNAATGTGTRLGIFFYRFAFPATFSGFATIFQLTYVALEVLYCEEQRLMVACGLPADPTSGFAYLPFGVWPIKFTDMAGNANPFLPAGAYTATVSMPEMQGSALSAYPAFNGLATAYNLPNIQGVQVVKPYPLFNNVGAVFTETVTGILPQLSLHVTGGAPIPECQVYGTVQGAQVYGGATVTQTIDTSPALAGTNFTQARYFARYFGAPEAALTLTVGGSNCVLTKAAHDALPQVVNGWKEVTLPMSNTIAMGGVGTAPFSFTSAATAGNRWEVLCLTAPSITGSAGDNQQLVPVAQQLSAPTYLSPSGGTADLTWITPAASGGVADIYTDAVLMLSQSPPTLTLTLTAQSQAVSGVGLLCGVAPPFMPTVVTYQRLSWTSPALTGSGFGYYELQRFDTVDNAWTTVMLAYTQATVSFNDFEARVGLVSSYRIRVANALGFLGAFSGTVTGTVAAPGVTGGRNAGNCVLVFTSNGSQSGKYTLAYPETAPDTQEDLTFVEAGRRQLQTMYGKNFPTAFTPLERGGEQFSRVMVVQNAAIAGPVLENAFQSIRDLGWAQLPYVCVRNELGDRWYANVNVPTGALQRNRQIQLVTLGISEISQVPAAVDPVTAV
jgi:hypothetical protein